MNDNISNFEQTQRTVKPQEVLQRITRSQADEQPVQQMMQQQMQQQAGGKQCPFCGAVNDPEAMFCAQCGQPISKTSCPYCGAEIDADADFCEVCHHYIRKDVCSFCGAHLTGNEAYCPECGSPRGGIVCPTCHSLNDFAFCKKWKKEIYNFPSYIFCKRQKMDKSIYTNSTLLMYILLY